MTVKDAEEYGFGAVVKKSVLDEGSCVREEVLSSM